jgi:hypothetical protein
LVSSRCLEIDLEGKNEEPHEIPIFYHFLWWNTWFSGPIFPETNPFQALSSQSPGYVTWSPASSPLVETLGGMSWICWLGAPEKLPMSITN